MAIGNNNKEGGAQGGGGGGGGNLKTVVLGLYLHCPECVKPLVKCLQQLQGVQEVIADFKAHTVNIKGSKDIDPKKLAERLQKKHNKVVEIISPIEKEKNNAAPPKKPQPKIIRVTLSIYIHCENCGKNIKHNIQKMAGVQSVEMNMKNLEMMVIGVFEPQNLVEYVNKKMGKPSSVIKTETVNGGKPQQQQQQEKPQQQQKEGQGGNGRNNNTNTSTSSCQNQGTFNCPLNFWYATEMFNDENSEACTIM